MTDTDLLEAVRVPGELVKLSDTQKEIGHAIIRGESNTEISVRFGVTTQYVARLKRDPTMLDFIGDVEVDLEKHRKLRTIRIQGMAHTALDVQEDVLTSETASEKAKVKVAADVLDRAGHPKISRQETDRREVFVDAAKLAEIEEIVRRAALEGREIIDVTHSAEEPANA